jgi:hypothetical protein
MKLLFLSILFYGLRLKDIAIYAHIQLILKDAKIQIVVNHLKLKQC